MFDFFGHIGFVSPLVSDPGKTRGGNNSRISVDIMYIYTPNQLSAPQAKIWTFLDDIFDVLRLKTSFSGYIFKFKMGKFSASGGKINYKKPPLVDRPAPNKGGFLIKGGVS